MIHCKNMPLKTFIHTVTMFVAGVVAGLCVFFPFASQVSAGDYQIQPTYLELNGNARSGAFSVISGDNDKLNIQISVMEWSQDATGKDVYTETRDIVFFPKIMTVEPREQRAIRIGFKGQPLLKEKTYRLFIEEIPSQKKKQEIAASGKITAGLIIAFRYSIPIFVKPLRQQESAVIDKAALSAGVLKTDVKNAGNIHVKLLNLKFHGKDAGGRELFFKEMAGWYILQDQSRPYETTVPADVCGNLATIEIKAEFENSKVEGTTLNVHKNMCAK